MNNIMKVEPESPVEKMIAESQVILSNALAKIELESRKQSERIKIVEDDNEQTKKKLEETDGKLGRLQKEVNVLGSPIHRKNLRHFKTISASRVREVLGNDKASYAYVLFATRFHKKIYSDIAYKFQIATYMDIDMDEYASPHSKFSEAKIMAKTWIPAACYVDEVLKELCELNAKNLLSKEKSTALKNYMILTNNGQVNPFTE